MRRRKNITPAVVLAALLACAPGPALADGENLLEDPSFELQALSGAGDWTPFEISMVSRNHARTGQQSMYNGGFSRSVPHPPYFIGNASGSYQELPAEPGSQWRLTGYGLIPAPLEGGPAFGVLQLSFFSADGEDLGTVETASADTKAKLSGEIDSRSAAGEWISLDTGIATAPEGTATVQAFTLFVDYSGKGRSQGVYFDDLALCEMSSSNESCRE